MKNPLSIVAEIAESQVGVHESGENTGSQVKKYQATTSLGGTGWPWCAAFVCWCFQEALKRPGFKLAVSLDQVPRSARAFGFDTTWAKSVKAFTFSGGKVNSKTGPQPKRGDIVVFSFSHVGIVTADYEGGGYVATVEGNTNEEGSREGNAVVKKRRSLSVCRNFVRPALEAISK